MHHYKLLETSFRATLSKGSVQSIQQRFAGWGTYLRYILVSAFILSSVLSVAQVKKTYSTNSKKAIKLFEESENYVVRREYEKAIEVLKKLQSVPLKLAEDTRIKREGHEMLNALQ